MDLIPNLDETIARNAIKRNNNTLRHYGEMASWQCRGVFVVNEKPDAEHEDWAKAVNQEEKMFQIEVSANGEEELNKRTTIRRGRPEV